MSEQAVRWDAEQREARKRIGILCLSAIPDDPRVRRQGDLMANAGWDVIAIGLPGHRSASPAWTCLAVGTGPVATSAAAAVGREPGPVPEASGEGGAMPPKRGLLSSLVRPVLVPVVRRIYGLWRIARIALQPSYAAVAFWRANERFERIYDLARREHVDLWLANDWTTLPIAARLAAEQGVPYGYDTHELAVDEYAQSLKWRLLQRPLIKGAEGAAIRGAAFVTCVSDGIADRLQEVYALARRPLVIRNMPHYRPRPPRPVGETIRVLYHGIVAPGRGLEASIRSVPLWRPEFHLTIRGPVHPAYQEALERIARQAGVAHRVVLDPPVPMTELVERAAEFDVGLFALPDHSKQNVYVLPNKFFEYTMAGLALCVSDLPEMAALLREYDLGRLIPKVAPKGIAEAINGFDRAAIDHCKANAAVAAASLNWEVEAKRLVQLIDEAARATRMGRLMS